ncbi:hypothetical protein RFI_38894, partial [Reticulomyxa filosa]
LKFWDDISQEISRKSRKERNTLEKFFYSDKVFFLVLYNSYFELVKEAARAIKLLKAIQNEMQSSASTRRENIHQNNDRDISKSNWRNLIGNQTKILKKQDMNMDDGQSLANNGRRSTNKQKMRYSELNAIPIQNEQKEERKSEEINEEN